MSTSSWQDILKAALKAALLQIWEAGESLRAERRPHVPLPDPGEWEVSPHLLWPVRDQSGNWYNGFGWRGRTRERYDAARLAGEILEAEGFRPSSVFQVIRKLEELRDHLVRLSEERDRAARDILESPEEQEALAEMEARAALQALREERP
jgi:hypothetical protein